MGGCASRPKGFDKEEAPIPDDQNTKKAEGKNFPQEKNNEGETEKEEPLIDLSEPAEEASKIQEATLETMTAKAVIISKEEMPAELWEVLADSTEKEIPGSWYSGARGEDRETADDTNNQEAEVAAAFEINR